VLGYPTFTVVMITIASATCCAACHDGAGLGTETHSLKTPFGDQVIASAARCLRPSRSPPSHSRRRLCLALYLFFRFARLGVAMQATSQNSLPPTTWHPGAAREYADLGLAAAVAAFAAFAGAERVRAFQHGLHRAEGVSRAVVGGFGSVPGAVVGGLIIASSRRSPASICPKASRTSRPTSWCWSCCCSCRPYLRRNRKKEGVSMIPKSGTGFRINHAQRRAGP